MTTVRPLSRFGVVEIEPDGTVAHFREKPKTDDSVNAGFFVFEPGVFDYLADDTALEREPLEALARDGELMAYSHDGFLQPMDTYRELTTAQRAVGRRPCTLEGVVDDEDPLDLVRPFGAGHRRERVHRLMARTAPCRRRRRTWSRSCRRVDPRFGVRMRCGSTTATTVVRGVLEDPDASIRTPSSATRSTPCSTSARRRLWVSRTVIRSPRSKRTCVARICCSTPAGEQADSVRTRRRGVERQGLRRRRRRCPTPKTLRSMVASPYEVSKSCTDLLAQAYADELRRAGCDRALRQRLRRRRPQLEPDRARHDPLRSCCGRAPGASAATARSCATTSTSTTSSTRTSRSPTGSTAA